MAAVTDPVSWLQIEQGWNVVTSAGVLVGTVAQVEGDKQADIFDGLAVATTQTGLGYVPGEQVGAIYPGEVRLTTSSADGESLEPFQAAPPETTIRPSTPSLGARISGWFRGN